MIWEGKISFAVPFEKKEGANVNWAPQIPPRMTIF
jgi:hypothetical protein